MSESESLPIATSRRITRSISRQLALYDLPIPPGLVSVGWPTPQSTPSYSKPCLGSLPAEIKRVIVGYLQDFDIQEKIHQVGLRSREIELLNFDPCGLDLVKLDPPSFMFHYHQTDIAPSSSIRALSSVNRSFYHFCQPWIWKFLDLKGLSNSQLEILISDILPLHRHHVRSIWWRSFDTRFYSDEGPIRRSMEDEEIFHAARSKLFLRIWHVCPHVIRLDIDMLPGVLGAWTPWGFELFHNAWRSSPFESHLRLDMPNLTSFSCTGIQTPFRPDSNFRLGFHLASLSKLENLTLSYVNCINGSWAALDWKGPIRSFSLSHCLALTLQELLVLVQRFSNTLVRLQLENSVQNSYNHNHHLANPLFHKLDHPTLELPRLSHLVFPVISNPITARLISKFLGCTALKKIYIGSKPPINYDQLIKLLENVDKSPLHSFDSQNPLDGFNHPDSITDENGMYAGL
ncbi:hypothetical protein O181_080411 [Austropuccinia psidii MF-1]|uniref:Uncharacterized protein n=1 Tax=Austropuccinia psidii MF-1 TaxID=1389203 RepID=A0A9Q3FNQ4_9BASI|nr:hypothetical protein [Austropuccinia psidii MF-1]